MTDPDAPPGARPRWRPWSRFLLATLAVTLLYLAVQALWLRLAQEAAHQGWTVNDPAQTHAQQAAEVAAQSRPREAALDPRWPHWTFQLGYAYGYLSQWLGGYGPQPEALMQQLAQPVAPYQLRMDAVAQAMGVAPVQRLPMRTAADFSELTRRIEEDPAGVAARVEAKGSPRLRHLFLMAAHVGTQSAALDAPPADTLPVPATALIGMHATLAGVPEDQWRPLARAGRGSAEERQREYQQAAGRLERALTAAAR